MKAVRKCRRCGREVEINMDKSLYLLIDNRGDRKISEIPGASSVPSEILEMFISGLCPQCVDEQMH